MPEMQRRRRRFRHRFANQRGVAEIPLRRESRLCHVDPVGYPFVDLLRQMKLNLFVKR